MEEIKIPQNMLYLSIRDPERLVFKGIVKTITTYNQQGLFDILAYHENFITSIKDKLIINQNEDKKEFTFKEGILKVEENIVHVFFGTERL